MSNKLTVNESPNKILVNVNEDGEVFVEVLQGNLTVNGSMGAGDVVGPVLSTDNAIVRFNGTDGKLIQNSGITIADGATGTLSGTNSGDVTVTDTDTVDLTIAGQALSGAVRTQQSITSDASGIKLSGDSASPGSSRYYGTDGAGSKGFHALPVGTVTSVGVAGTDGIEVDSGSPVTGSGTITLGVNAATMKTTLDLAGTNTGDQNLFSTIAVSGQSNVVADTTSDTLTLVAGSNITISTDAATDSITINSTASGSGDVVGPGSATDNALARFDTTTGKLIQSGLITEDDDGNLSGVNFIQLDTTPTGSLTAQGQLGWNADEETVDIQLNSFTLHVGEHTVYHVKNDTGSTIAKGVPVMFAGTDGSSGKLLIAPWNGTGPSVYFMGLTAEELSNGEEGFVIAFGKIRGIQTNGGNYGQTWTNGEIIYLGTTTGSLTDTQPAAPNPHVIVAAVVSAHATNGTLFIRPSLGSNIKDDEGVTITSLTSGQVLVANAAGTVFENKSVSGDATLANTGALTIASGAVSYAKMQDVSAASRLLGRGSAGGAGDVEELTVGSGLSLSGTTLSATVVDTGITQLTGDVTAGPGSGSQATTIANNAVTYAKIQDVSAASRLLGRGSASGSGDPQEITIGSGLAMTGTTLSATGSGSGDMTKAVYDAANTGFISGKPGDSIDDGIGGAGGTLKFDGGDSNSGIGENGGVGGSIDLSGGNSPGLTVAGGAGGSIISLGSSDANHSGGTLNMSAGASGSGGNITTSNNGGSVDTTGTGSIGLGATGTRTTIQGAAAADWTLTLPTGDGDAGQYLKTDGAGVTSWDTPAGGVTDGDKGDITVSSSGTVWTIDNSAVTLAKMANLAQDQFIGRTTASTGVPQTATITAAARTVLDDTSTSAMRTTLGVGTGDAPTFQALTINDAGGGSSQSPTIHFTGDLGLSTLMASNAIGELWELPENSGYLALTNLSDGRTNLAANVTGTLPVANGGTGQTTQTAAFDALAPTTTKGDLIVHNGSDNIRVAVGATNGHVLTVDSATASGVKWAAGGGGGLTNITETLNTASPNNTVNAEQLAVTGGTTNVDLVLTPKGTGALILGPQPDSTITGGNKRGVGAVDLQMSRDVASRAATGERSFAVGASNTASGRWSVAMGLGNTASGDFSTTSGMQNSASGEYDVALGYQVNASSTNSVIIGRNGSASARGAVAIGESINATATYAVAIGESVTASAEGALAMGTSSLGNRYGMSAYASGRFAAQGDAMSVCFVARNKTTTNSAVTLFLNGLSTRLTIPSGKILHAQVTLLGSKSDGTAVASYMRQVTIKNVSGTTSLVGTVNTLGVDEAAGTSIAITADDTNDALQIAVTGITAETWRWVAVVEGVEIAYGT